MDAVEQDIRELWYRNPPPFADHERRALWDRSDGFAQPLFRTRPQTIMKRPKPRYRYRETVDVHMGVRFVCCSWVAQETSLELYRRNWPSVIVVGFREEAVR